MEKEHVISVLQEFVEYNRGDSATIELLVSLGSQLLDISFDEMAEILNCEDEVE